MLNSILFIIDWVLRDLFPPKTYPYWRQSSSIIIFILMLMFAPGFLGCVIFWYGISLVIVIILFIGIAIFSPITACVDNECPLKDECRRFQLWEKEPHKHLNSVIEPSLNCRKFRKRKRGTF